MSVRERLAENKGTVIRLTFHGRSGNLFKINPLIDSSAGFVRGLTPSNHLLNFESPLATFYDNSTVFLSNSSKHTSLLRLVDKTSRKSPAKSETFFHFRPMVGVPSVRCYPLELREVIIGITSLVMYPDGSTWEGLIGSDITKVRAMVWSPELATKIKNPSSELPWKSELDWKSVPTAVLVTQDEQHPMCAHIEHSCCDPCK